MTIWPFVAFGYFIHYFLTCYIPTPSLVLSDYGGTACFAVVAVTSLISTTLVCGTAVSVTSSRWVYPCSGGMVVEGIGNSVSGLTFEEQVGAPAAVDMVDSVDWYSTLHILAEVTVRLKRMVQDLKTLYVSFISLVCRYN